MTFIDAIGYLAACLTTLSFVPQAFKIFKSKDVSAISLWMYALFTLGVFLWLVYGILTMMLPVIFANFITLCLAVAILTMKIIYK